MMSNYRVTLKRYIEQPIYNGPMSLAMMLSMGLSKQGCPYSGTTTCYKCPWHPPVECQYVCSRCDHRAGCKCGWDQTGTLQAMGLVE